PALERVGEVRVDVVRALQESVRIFGHHQLFVRGDDENPHLRAGTRDFRLGIAGRGDLVLPLVQHDAHVLQALEALFAGNRTALPDARGEHDRVDSTEGGVVGAEVFLQTVPFYLNGQLAAFVSLAGARLDVPPVGVLVRDSQDPAL